MTTEQTTTPRYAVYWISPDGQRSIPGCHYSTRAEAEAALPDERAALAEAGITGGTMMIDERGVDDLDPGMPAIEDL